MNRILISVFVLCLLIFVSACPKPAPEDTGGTTATTTPGEVKTPPAPPDFRESKLAKFDDIALGMKSEELSALYPAEGNYSLINPTPDEKMQFTMIASPKEGTTGNEKIFGFLEGELIYCMSGGKMTDEEFGAKVEEYKKLYGDPTKEAPAFLKDTEFWSGPKKEVPEGTEPKEGEAKEPPSEDMGGGMGSNLPTTAVFWADEANKIVLFGATENGEAGFFLIRADKIDAQMAPPPAPEVKEGATTPPAEGDKGGE